MFVVTVFGIAIDSTSTDRKRGKKKKKNVQGLRDMRVQICACIRSVLNSGSLSPNDWADQSSLWTNRLIPRVRYVEFYYRISQEIVNEDVRYIYHLDYSSELRFYVSGATFFPQ